MWASSTSATSSKYDFILNWITSEPDETGPLWIERDEEYNDGYSPSKLGYSGAVRFRNRLRSTSTTQPLVQVQNVSICIYLSLSFRPWRTPSVSVEVCNGPYYFVPVQPTPRVSIIPILKH